MFSTQKDRVLISVNSDTKHGNIPLPRILSQEGFSMKLKPLGDRVVLQFTQAEETSKGGIILASSAQEKPQVAEILEVGPGGMIDGKEVKMEVKVGDKVILNKYAGTEVKLGSDEYVIAKQSDILAIVE